MKLNPDFAESPFQRKVKELADYLYVLRGCKGHSSSYRSEAEKRLLESMASERTLPAAQSQHLSN